MALMLRQDEPDDYVIATGVAAQRAGARRARLRARRPRLARVRAHRRVAPPRRRRAPRPRRRLVEGAASGSAGRRRSTSRGSSACSSMPTSNGCAANRLGSAREAARPSCSAVAAALGAGAAARPPRRRRPGKFIVVFAPPQNARREAPRLAAQGGAAAARLRGALKALILPRNITISVQGGEPGRPTTRSTGTIVLNHPFSALVLNVLPEGVPEDHAVRPRRAVRRARVLRPLPRGRPRARRPVEPARARARGGRGRRLLDDLHDGVREARRLRARRRGLLLRPRRDTGKLSEVDFADEHSFDKQRAYSIACWVYGTDPVKYGYLEVGAPGRAARALHGRVPAS